MKGKSIALLSALLAGGLAFAEPLGTAFNYQGRLDRNGQPAPNGIYHMIAVLFTQPTDGAVVGSNAVFNVPVTNGLFHLELDFGASVFTGEARWLELRVTDSSSAPFEILAPRTRMAPTPNALFSVTAGIAGSVSNRAIQVSSLAVVGTPASGQVLTYDGTGLAWQGVAAVSGAWSVNGNNAAPGEFLGTTGNQPLDFRVNNARALRLEPTATSPNVVGGWRGNAVDAGVTGATISGGGAALAFGLSASNRVTDDFGSIAGGTHNLAGNTNGSFNDAYYATVGGGHFNLALGIASTIAGGAENRVENNNSFVGGGYQNSALGYISTIGGGEGNVIVANGSHSVIAGGNGNSCGTNAAFVGGGTGNHANGSSSTLAGGYDNTITGDGSFIGGGARNRVPSVFCVVTGGERNTASGFLDLGAFGTVGHATVSGGFENHASGILSAVGGGANNTASGNYAIIPGGCDNSAPGYFSFAAGRRAKANGRGSFVWADSSDADFFDSGDNTFCVRASGGVRFQTQFLQASGSGNEQAYIGGDGAGGEVHVGSLNPAVNTVAIYNSGASRWMNLTACSITILGGCDLAEPFPMKEERIEKGSIVVIDDEHPGRLKRSLRAYDTRVAGIVSGANGIHPGIALKQEGVLDQGENVALTGRVYAKADASFGAIKPGDLLTTSDTPGHAMKVSDPTRAQGAILGKAMSALDQGTGLVLVLVTLQ